MSANLTAKSIFSDHYFVKSQIENSGMSDSYLAIDNRTETEVIISISQFSLSMLGYSTESFNTLGNRLMGFRQKHIAKVMTFGLVLNSPFFIMEFIRGINLSEYFAFQSNVNLYSFLGLYEQIAQALQFLHSRGIIHCDVKPSNILITSEKVPVLTDFGISKLYDSKNSMRAQEMIWGSQPFIAPELVLGENYSPRSDIFSFGVMLYQSLLGNFPYHTEKTNRGLLFHHERQIDFPNKINPFIPNDLSRLIEKCLAINPDHRFESFYEITREIREIKAQTVFSSVWIPGNLPELSETTRIFHT